MADLQALSAPNLIAPRTPAPTPQLAPTAPTPRLPEITPDRGAAAGPQRSEAAGLVPGTSAGIPRELLMLAGAVSGAVPLNVDLDVVLFVLAHTLCNAVRRRLPGYHAAVPDTLQRRFLNTGGTRLMPICPRPPPGRIPSTSVRAVGEYGTSCSGVGSEPSAGFDTDGNGYDLRGSSRRLVIEHSIQLSG